MLEVVNGRVMGFSRNTPHSDLVTKFKPGMKLYVHKLEFSQDSTSRFAQVVSVVNDIGETITLEEPVWVSMSSNNLDFLGSAIKREYIREDGSHLHMYTQVSAEAKTYEF